MHYGIALGTNLGESRMGNLQLAVGMILASFEDVTLEAVGGVYETQPVDCPEGSASFYNSVIEIATELTPIELQKALQEIEKTMGRATDAERNAPRIIDLDILYADDMAIDKPGLTVPHPRMGSRRFVLQPLADIRPDMGLPGLNGTVAQVLAGLKDDPAAVRLIAPEWIVAE